MRDLEILAQGVLDRESKTLFSEAVGAYRAGAYRAAIISLWISASVDLTNKVRHLAEAGDAAAKKAVKKLDEAVASQDVKGMQAFESGLLTLCLADLQLITTREHVDLARLYADRNLCAHPGFSDSGDSFQPSAELVRNHLAAACDAALSQPGIAGKQLINGFIEEIKGDSWPQSQIVPYLREKYFGRSRPHVSRNLAEIILKGCLEPPEGVQSVARRCKLAAAALYEIDQALFSETMSAVLRKKEDAGTLSDVALIRFVGMLGAVEASWQHLPGSARMRLIALLENDDVDSAFLMKSRLFASGYPADPEVLALYKAALERLTVEEIDDQIVRPYPREQWVDAALLALSESSSYRGAELNMRRVLRASEGFASSHVGELKSIVLSNGQVREASAVPDLMVSLFENTSTVSGIKQEWLLLSQALKEKQRQNDPSDPDGYYSYPALAAAIADA